MSPDSFRAWRIRLFGERGQKAAAAALGCSKTTLRHYERGFADIGQQLADDLHIDRDVPRAIPRYIALACQALANGLPPME